MKHISLLLALFAAVAVLAMPRTVEAVGNTMLDLVLDNPAGGSELLDMEGPTGYGFLNYSQNNQGDLKLVVSLKNASPDYAYNGVFVTCGPTHDTACGFVDVGDLTTNGQGNGTATIWVSVEDLQASPFGPGERTDHLDLLGPDGEVITASVMEYVVPEPAP